jgi:hypothetical protein
MTESEFGVGVFGFCQQQSCAGEYVFFNALNI